MSNVFLLFCGYGSHTSFFRIANTEEFILPLLENVAVLGHNSLVYFQSLEDRECDYRGIVFLLDNTLAVRNLHTDIELRITLVGGSRGADQPAECHKVCTDDFIAYCINITVALSVQIIDSNREFR